MNQNLSLRHSALNYLALREYGCSELMAKLIKKFGDAEKPAINNLLLQLKKENLVNDERFTEIFIRTKLEKGIGPNKISYELKLKGIDPAIAQTALQKISPEQWINRMKKSRNKKFGDKQPRDFSEKQKQYRYLYQRGFSSEQINQIVNE